LDNRLVTELCVLFDAVPDDARRIMERRLSTGAYQSPAQNIAIKRPEKIGMLDVDSPAGTPGSLGAASPASPSMASPSSCKCTFLKEVFETLR
jgi:hypothetical protein